MISFTAQKDCRSLNEFMRPSGMRTCVRGTSIDTYYSLDFTNQQKKIVEALKVLDESCISDIATYLNWQRSTVSGRLNDLKKLGIVECVGKRKSESTGINSEHWRLQ
jgi:DNA-binding MarR family transcriptional regulator